MFLEKYFPRVKREKKEMEFISLKQGNLSLVEYERKFDELSRYAPHLVDIEERKARRFERGLRPELYKAVAMFQFSTYSEILPASAVDCQRLCSGGRQAYRIKFYTC